MIAVVAAAGTVTRADLHEFRITPRGTRVHHRLQSHHRMTSRRLGGPADGIVVDGVAREVERRHGAGGLGVAQHRARSAPQGVGRGGGPDVADGLGTTTSTSTP